MEEEVVLRPKYNRSSTESSDSGIGSSSTPKRSRSFTIYLSNIEQVRYNNWRCLMHMLPSSWRPTSFVSLGSRKHRSLQAASDNIREGVTDLQSNGSDIQGKRSSIKESNKRGWSTIVNIILVEAKGLPSLPDDNTHNVYCKIRLGSESYKSKSASSNLPEWKERFKLHLNKDHFLRISLWDKGKQTNFMGSCAVDLSELEKERSHDVWQELDDGFGSVHVIVTMYTVRNSNESPVITPNFDTIRENFAVTNLKADWKTVGQLYVKVIGARGFNGRPNAHCVLELDNQLIETHSVKDSEPVWNKHYLFDVYDVTSTLDIKVHENSLMNISPLWNESLGYVSIPLLRIQNRESHWYALKNKSKRNSAKGNCPRIQLEMTLIYNPMRASLRLLRPKEVKYIKKSPKFDLGLVHSNMIFVRNTFEFLFQLNEAFKQFLEWDNREISSVALILWLTFWFYCELWTIPLLMLSPFVFHWMYRRNQTDSSVATSSTIDDDSGDDIVMNDLNITPAKIKGLPELTLKITSSVEYMASIAERLNNLVTFKVPFLSYLTMVILIAASFLLYYIPVKYLFMAFGFYKYTRKHLNPGRTPNNDILDFISRIPDNEILKDWKEFGVPEPNAQISSSNMLCRTSSSKM